MCSLPQRSSNRYGKGTGGQKVSVEFPYLIVIGIWMTLYRFNNILYMRTAFKNYWFLMVLESEFFSPNLTQEEVDHCHGMVI